MDHPPYERSCELLKIVVKRQRAWMERAEIARADAREVRSNKRDFFIPAQWVDRTAKPGAPHVEVKHGDKEWKRWADFLVARAEAAYLGARDYVRWLQNRIDFWAPRPLYDELDLVGKKVFEGRDGAS